MAWGRKGQCTMLFVTFGSARHCRRCFFAGRQQPHTRRLRVAGAQCCVSRWAPCAPRAHVFDANSTLCACLQPSNPIHVRVLLPVQSSCCQACSAVLVHCSAAAPHHVCAWLCVSPGTRVSSCLFASLSQARNPTTTSVTNRLCAVVRSCWALFATSPWRHCTNQRQASGRCAGRAMALHVRATSECFHLLRWLHHSCGRALCRHTLVCCRAHAQTVAVVFGTVLVMQRVSTRHPTVCCEARVSRAACAEPYPAFAGARNQCCCTSGCVYARARGASAPCVMLQVST